MDFYRANETPQLHYATADGQPLNLSFDEAHQAIQTYASKAHQRQDGTLGEWEFFGAGYGDQSNSRSHGHRSIERVLADVGFDEEKDLPVIYFGNWLRDFSQLIDPKILRPEPDELINAQQHYRNSKTVKAAAMDTLRLSRVAMTRLVGFVALKEFSEEENKQLPIDFMNRLLREDGSAMHGTRLLGGYRPEEHMDNPMPGLLEEHTDWEDYSKTVSPLFAPPPTLVQLAINPTTGLKNYINTPTLGQRFPTAVEYMESQLQAAMLAGYTDEGLIHFGQALHVLEDYFAHSNFVEVSLIKHGYSKVYPWVDIPLGSKRIPVVTGLFGSTDMAGSLLPKIVDLLQHHTIEDYKGKEPGERTLADYVILTVLGDLSKAQQADSTVKQDLWLGMSAVELFKYYNTYLGYRDQLAAGKADWRIKWLFKSSHYIVQAILYLMDTVLYNLLHPLTHAIDDYQTLFKNQPLGTNPSHSQLGKDHDDRHFHDLAARLARIAVRQVGDEMFNYFKGDKTRNPILKAKQYIVHPLDTVDKNIDREVISWSKDNPSEIDRGESRHIIEHHQKELVKLQKKLQKRLSSVLGTLNELYLEINK